MSKRLRQFIAKPMRMGEEMHIAQDFAFLDDFCFFFAFCAATQSFSAETLRHGLYI